MASTITYEDLSLEGLIQHYESKKDARSKMTLSYLKESMELHRIFYGGSSRERLLMMRKYPTRQQLMMKARLKNERNALRIALADHKEKELSVGDKPGC